MPSAKALGFCLPLRSHARRDVIPEQQRDQPIGDTEFGKRGKAQALPAVKNERERERPGFERGPEYQEWNDVPGVKVQIEVQAAKSRRRACREELELEPLDRKSVV